MDTYLREFAQSLRLDPNETRAIVAEVRGNLEDLIAHLRAHGYPPEDAEEEAIRRFDDAGGLAHALHRAHRGAPTPLRVVGVLVGAAGLSALLLTLAFVQTIAAAAFQRTGVLDIRIPNPMRPGFGQGLIVLLTNLTPIIVPGLIAVASLWVAVVTLRGRRRRRWRGIGVGAAIVALLDGVLFLLVAATFPHGTTPTDAVPALVPNARALFAAGLTGQPPPGQPQRPVAVDRVLVDTTATYVQYHIPDVPHDGRPLPALFDDHGRAYTGGADSSSYRPIDQLMPWRPPEPHLDQFAPLHPDAHAAVLRFSMGAQVVETVRVPVNLGALRLAGRVSHPNVTATSRVCTVAITMVTRGVSVSQLTYTLTPSPAVARLGQLFEFADVALMDSQKRRLDTVGLGTWGTGRRCTSRRCIWTTSGYPFVSARPGTHLTLTLSTLEIDRPQARTRSIPGTWRLSFVMP